MIARVSILLPFDLLIREGDALPTLELTASDYPIKVYPPSHFVDRTKITDGAFDPAISLHRAHVLPFSDSLFAAGPRVAQVNVLILDFFKPEFNRSVSRGKMPSDAQMSSIDPAVDLVFGIANTILAKLRIYSRAFQIKKLVSDRDPFRIHYLTDGGQELEEEDRKIGSCFHGHAMMGFPTLTPEVFAMVASSGGEPYVWDQLLLDAYGLLPDAGAAIVMASAALETFIGWALDIFQQEGEVPAGLWNWIKKRDHYTRGRR